MMYRSKIAAILLLSTFLPNVGSAQGPAQPQGESASIVFLVEDNEGRAIAGATLSIWGEDGVRRFVLTNEEGSVRLELAPGGLYILATAKGRTGQTRDDIWLEPSAEVRVEFRLEPGVPFEGRVVGPDGEPVEGAEVAVLEGGTYEGEILATVRGETYFAFPQPDAEGRFRVGGIPPGQIATVMAWAEGYSTSEVYVKAIGDTVRPSPLVLELEKSGLVRGRVLDPEGSPVEGAVVYLVPADADMLRESPELVVSTTEGTMSSIAVETDSAGRFEALGLPLDVPLVAFAGSEGFAKSADSEVIVLTRSARERDVDLRLQAGATLIVRVSLPDGTLVDEAPVAVGSSDFGSARERADEPGIFRFEGLDAGPRLVRIEDSEFQYLEHREEVELDAGEERVVDVTLNPGVAIEGVLVDSEGNPRSEAFLRVYRASSEVEGWMPALLRQCEVGDEGRFRLGGLLAGTYSVVLYDDGFDLTDPSATITAPASGLRLEAIRLGSVSVRLLTPDGAPFEGRMSTWYRSEGGGGGGITEQIEGGLVEFSGFRGETTRYELQPEGFAHLLLDVTANSGESLELDPIRLDPGWVLDGRVVDLEGNPVAGAVASFGDYQAYAFATSDEKGRLRLSHLPARRIDIAIDAERFLPATKTVEAGAQSVEITLERGAVVRGAVVTQDGGPDGDRWFLIERLDTSVEEGWSRSDSLYVEPDGTFAQRIPSGSHRIVAGSDDTRAILWTRDLKEGETIDVKLVLPDF